MVEYIVDMFRKKDLQKVRIEGSKQPVAADYTKAERNLIHVGFKGVLS